MAAGGFRALAVIGLAMVGVAGAMYLDAAEDDKEWRRRATVAIMSLLQSTSQNCQAIADEINALEERL